MNPESYTAQTPLEVAQAVADWNDRERKDTPERDEEWGELLRNLLGGSLRPEIHISERPLSPPYEKAIRNGQHIVFVCAQGQERSVAAAQIAQLRGEKHTHYLDGGFYSFGENVKSQARNKAKAEMNLFHRQPDIQEVQALNQRVDQLAFPQLQTLMLRKLAKIVGGDPTKHAFLRIFYDERSLQADEFMRVLDSLHIPYETVTSPQMSAEIKSLKMPGDAYDVAGHNWLVV